MMTILTPQPLSAGGDRWGCRGADSLRRMTSSELTAGHYDAWRQLLDEDPEAGVPTLPEVVQLRDDVRFLWLMDDGRVPRAIALLLPETIRIGQHLLPGSRQMLRGFHLAGNRLLAHDHEAATAPMVAAIADEIIASGRELLALEDVLLESPLWNELKNLERQGFYVCTPLRPQPHYRLVLPTSPDVYWARFSARTRSQMRRRKRQLDTVVRRLTRPEDVDEFLDVGHALSLMTWQWHRTQLCLANDANARLFHRRLAEMGLWRAYLLFSGEKPVAYVDGWQTGGTYHYIQPGFDQAFAKQGPGRVLITSIIDDLFEYDTPLSLDFGPGSMPYKAEFGTEHTLNATVWVLPPGTASWRIVQSLKWKQRLHKSAKAILTRTGLFARIRRLNRRRLSVPQQAECRQG